MYDTTEHPGERIRQMIAERHYPIGLVAGLLGINRPNLNNVINCKVALSHDLACRIAAFFADDVEEQDRIALDLLQRQLWHDWNANKARRETIRREVGATFG
ncbi:hypothetical protein QH494_02620 [Sphingomonas sp. AR_OL41]|uniref:helix-turn-helix transcriptional regulator n=1 Tax=Sphingomonas sp. AR_OL41 TaxID=3042729 RepID=UPI00247FD026|nr:hypothetical protein [Sphingomonas sp. AR_OL41]MDH7971063.1 hypothetical protein [Sphingomonas sp. AR_OL41]